MDEIDRLSSTARAGIATGGAMVFMASGLAIGMRNWTALFVLLGVLAALLSMGFGLFYVWRSRQRRQRSAHMEEQLDQHTASAPRSVSDPGKLGRIEDLRKKFNDGVQVYRSRGKDLYKLPWYVLVGESGGGKTEAIRHSQVRFPEGITDYYQGVGGTLNMNWWFTDGAVVLDTAGKMMFSEVAPGETSEWKEFLNLLKRTRPHCPINGLLLVIPADTLIKDTSDDILRKSRKIAQQLDVIQRVLDVRFPVFVVVSKCDMVGGFREFFDGMTDPNLQHQITGWTNEEPLDAPFRAEKVEQHLDTVAQRLRKRRLWLLHDPAPAPDSTTGRRVDEVDSLYSFPHNLTLLGSRLRRYLETIFVAGEWSAKPMFLRGIYFSSAMREGTALDEELAQFMGVPIGELSASSGKLWERERSYFLRDLLMEKVFKERGLVTRASNTRKMLRARQLALYGAVSAALIVFIVLAVLGLKDFKNAIGTEIIKWEPAKEWVDGVMKASITETNFVQVDRNRVTLGEYHAGLARHVESPVKRSWLFPGLGAGFAEQRKRAQRIVFEGGVVRPLLEATRKKFHRELPDDPAYLQLQPAALATVIQLESGLLPGTRKAPVTAQTARNFLGGLQSFAAGVNLDPDTNLVATMVYTYDTNQFGLGRWPMLWMSGTPTNRLANPTGLADNQVLQDGLNQFLALLARNVRAQTNDLLVLTNLVQRLTACQRLEWALFQAAQKDDSLQVSNAYKAMGPPVQELWSLVSQVTNTTLFSRSSGLSNAYESYVERVVSLNGQSVALVSNALRQAMTDSRDYPIFKDMLAALDRECQRLSTVARQTIPREDLTLLDGWGWVNQSFLKRWERYRACGGAVDAPLPKTGEHDLNYLDEWARKIKPVRDRLEEYAGPYRKEALDVCNLLLREAEFRQTDGFCSEYVGYVRQDLLKTLGFPVLRQSSKTMEVDGVGKARKMLLAYEKDMGTFTQPRLIANPLFKQTLATVRALGKVAQSLLRPDGSIAHCKVNLAVTEDLPPAEVERLRWRDYWDHVVLNNFDPLRAFVAQVTTIGEVPLDKLLVLKVRQRSSEQEREVMQWNDWGLLRMMFDNAAKSKPPADGKTWPVEVAIKKPPLGWPETKKWENFKIPLVFIFENPMPDLSETDWPPLLPWNP